MIYKGEYQGEYQGEYNMNKSIVPVCLLSSILFSVTAHAQTSPESFLGHQVGADRKLADYHQIRAYFQKLDEESDKVQLMTIGQSTLGEPMIMAVISS